MRRIATLLAVVVGASAPSAPASAYCRRTTPAYTDATPIRIVIHPDMQNYIRHPFIDPANGLPRDDFACTSSSQCGTDGLCVSGHPAPATSRCRGPRWTRSELERAVLWVVGRINNETPADIPFAYVDLHDTRTCVIDDVCDDFVYPWAACIQSNTIVILPSECEQTEIASFSWNGSWWVPTDSSSRNKLLRMGWSGSPGGMSWEHTAGHTANNFGEQLLHELGHGLGLGHIYNDFPADMGTCVPNVAPGTVPHPLCRPDSLGTCPVMHGQGEEPGTLGLNQHFFGMDDIQGLVALYDVDSAPDTRLYEDCDLGATPSFTELSTTDLPLITDMAAAPVLPLNAVGSVASVVASVGLTTVPSFKYSTGTGVPPHRRRWRSSTLRDS